MFYSDHIYNFFNASYIFFSKSLQKVFRFYTNHTCVLEFKLVGIFIFRMKGITVSIRTFSTIPEKKISSKHQLDNPKIMHYSILYIWYWNMNLLFFFSLKSYFFLWKLKFKDTFDQRKNLEGFKNWSFYIVNRIECDFVMDKASEASGQSFVCLFDCSYVFCIA